MLQLVMSAAGSVPDCPSVVIVPVLGTGVATDRIRSGQRITVDGDTGSVSWSESSPRGG
jgi:hypothetical protein